MPRKNTPLTRESWIAVARKVFVSQGVDGVKIDGLARRLKISRGSFYWHFKSRKDLLDALLLEWEERNRAELQSLRSHWEKHTPDMADTVRLSLSRDPSVPTYDMAIRIWARKSRPVAQMVRRIDSEWMKLLEAMFLADGRSETESLVRARIVFFYRVGCTALELDDDFDELLRLAPYHTEVFTGRAPSSAHQQVIADLSANPPPSRRRR